MFGTFANSTGQSVIVTTGSGTTLTMATGYTYSYVCDGTNVTGAPVITEAASPGDIEFTTALSTPPLWLRCYGQAVSRTTYALLFAALTYTTTATANGTNQLTGVAGLPPNADGYVIGFLVEGAGISNGTLVTAASGSGPYTLTLSNNIPTGSITIRFVPYGQGDGSTTFNVPDMRGRMPLGADAMGGSPANRVSLGVSGISATNLGVGGGSQQAQKDSLTASSTASSSATTTLTDPGHGHQVMGSSADGGIKAFGDPGSNGIPGAGGTSNGYLTDVGSFVAIHSSTTGITAATTVSTSVSTTVTSSLTGTSQNMPPLLVGTWKIYAGA